MSPSQQEYHKRVSEIVSQAVQKIKENTGDLRILFQELVDTFGKARYEMHRYRRELFGIRREVSEGVEDSWCPYMTTPIKNEHNSSRYKAYNPRLLSRIRPHFKKMVDEGLESLIVSEGGDASLNIQIVDAEKLRSIGEVYQTKEGLWCFEKPHQESFTAYDIESVVHNKEQMEEVRKQSPDMYEKIKFAHISHLPIGFGCFYVKATLQHTVKNESCDHTQYIISIFDDAVQSDSLEFASTTFILHQDVFLIQKMLDEIADLFTQAMEWSGEEPQELINMVAAITYKFAHATPFYRGSAAIGEWLETVIYAYHGYDMLYDNNFNINMEALILPFNDFIQQYPKMFKLELNSLNQRMNHNL